MKFFACLVLLFCAARGSDDTECYDSVIRTCAISQPNENVQCNSIMGGFNAAQADLQVFTNNLLASSFEYQLLATNFNSFENNQPGFKKLFLWLADNAWNKGIDMIKYITKRGGKADFKVMTDGLKKNGRHLELDVLHAFSLALDSEKKLLAKAHHIHRRVSRHDNQNHYDPSIAHFIEENFLEQQPNVIRKISGYVNDLVNLAKSGEAPLAFYLFDEHLAGLSSII